MRHAPGGGAPALSGGGGFLTEIWIVFAIIAGVVGFFIWDRLPVIAVCVGCAMALWATGVLTLNQALAGFGDPATIFVTSLFVVCGRWRRPASPPGPGRCWRAAPGRAVSGSSC